jgi:glutathione S-transferase
MDKFVTDDHKQRGLVPTLQYTPPSTSTTYTLTESAQIVIFLADLHPSHLLPVIPDTPQDHRISSAHLHYRMSQFVDLYFTKINPLMFKMVGAGAGEKQEGIVNELLGLLETEIEPLFARQSGDGTGPFFAGRERLTYVEVPPPPYPTATFHYVASR